VRPSDESGDERLMARYLAGDNQAFGQLFTRLAPRVYGFFMRSFGEATLAEELVQATFFNVHRSRETYRVGLPVRPWLFTIAARVRKDELRRRYRLKEDCDEDALERAEEAMATRAATDSDGDGQGERAARVRAAIDRLPESQRVVVQLHRFEGLTFAQIAEILGTTALAVRARAFRAYETLRVELADLVQASATTATRGCHDVA
jgi:RNA polymerase sigma-70 factor (ECF subfamily)